jgi:vacuolar-type H+-ATPase subunit I/STV1
MNAALVLARFWGIILVVLSASLLVNAKFYVRLVKGLQDESVRFLYFFVVLVIGAVNVSFFFNQWAWNLRGIITLLGWGALLKGSFGILLPDLSNKIIQRVNLSPVVIYPTGVIMLIVGVYLLFYGFVY